MCFEYISILFRIVYLFRLYVDRKFRNSMLQARILNEWMVDIPDESLHATGLACYYIISNGFLMLFHTEIIFGKTIERE